MCTEAVKNKIDFKVLTGFIVCKVKVHENKQKNLCFLDSVFNSL